MKLGAKTEAHVRAVAEAWLSAYSTRNVEAIVEMAANDADAVFVASGEGEMAAGPIELRKALEADFGRLKGMRLDHTWVTISGAGAVAWAVADCRWEIVAAGKQSRVHGRLTIVLENRMEKWIVAHSRYSVPAPEAPRA